MTNAITNDVAGTGPDREGIYRLEHTLGDWRARIDDLKVQLELGAMDANDTLSEHLRVVQNAYLAARSSLTHARESGSDLAAVRRDVTHMVRALKAAYEAMDEAVARSHKE
jgi:hypothetical protein